MYAFGPIPQLKHSGRIIGTHQKIDRVARRLLTPYITDDLPFPNVQSILHFEGSRGPDGIKMKSPGRDEPWHFINPADIQPDDRLLVAIRGHSYNLSQALRNEDTTRASFEAAWLAHAVTDGLTPAHHDPLDDQVKDLRATDHRKDKFRGRIVMTGNGSGKTFVENNWKYWGAKGIMTTHTLFEGGIASTTKALSFNTAALKNSETISLKQDGFEKTYIDMVQEVDKLKMYDSFKAEGWTHTLALQTTRQLMPIIIKAVTLAWYDAYLHALEQNKP